MKYELWRADPADGHSLIREDNFQAQEFARSQGMVVVWSTSARGFNEASQHLFDHLGFGTFEVFLGEDGKPFPHLENDDF